MSKSIQSFFIIILLTVFITKSFSQKIVEHYAPLKKDSLRIGKGPKDFFPYIQEGYTLMLPNHKKIKGVLIFLEDSGYDEKNKSAKQTYSEALKKNFAVLSVSTEIPFDFYFSNSSIISAHKLIEKAFTDYKLPNKNIFFLGVSLTGHRAMRYIKVSKENSTDFQLKIKGVVICNFTLDWTRKWYQHKREIRIKRNNLWEPTFINYMLETHLKGTPKTSPNSYHNFSTYSYYDEKNRNIPLYKNYAIRAYIEPAIKYKLTKQYKTLYENNSTDIVSFLAELKLAGNENTDLIVLQPGDNPSKKKTVQSTWDAINKAELMNWIHKQTEK
ncbi:hypothetical protein [Tenacibaculum aiptasiae]|uniref:hypothetical protein n=1 Tax=Tenacibaculum aiptasiae TaxID=426481 RepID=UPI00232B3E43|nr:hypothetical protein [Tenacibaculum aiptasiae]